MILEQLKPFLFPNRTPTSVVFKGISCEENLRNGGLFILTVSPEEGPDRIIQHYRWNRHICLIDFVFYSN